MHVQFVKKSTTKVDERLIPAIIMMWYEEENQDKIPLPILRRLCERSLKEQMFPKINVKDWEQKAKAWSRKKTIEEMAVLDAQYCFRIVK
jgi:hypothetical protein